MENLVQKNSHIMRVIKPMEQVTGIEPAYLPWQGSVLPLNYTCSCMNKYNKQIKIMQYYLRKFVKIVLIL